MHQRLQVAHQVLLPPHCLGHPQTMLTTGRDTPSCALALQQLKPSRAAALRQLARVHAVLLRPSSSQPLTACQDCHTWQVRLCTDAVNSVVQHTVNSAAYHALHWVCCTLDVSIVTVTLLSRHELWCDSGCCELQSKPCVVPAGHCNAEIQGYIAYHVSTLDRRSLDGGGQVFACGGDGGRGGGGGDDGAAGGGGGPVSIMPCQLVPNLKVCCISSAVSPPASLPLAGFESSLMPCLHTICM